MKKRTTIVASLLLAVVSLMAQSKVSPYTQHVMRESTAITRSSDQMVSVYLHTEGMLDKQALEALGARVTLQMDDITTVRMPLSNIPQVGQLPFVKYLQIGTPVNQMLDKARAVSGVDRVLAGEGLDMPLTGKGVVVGVIDAGFDYTHPAFYDDATGALRIMRVWEQAAESAENAPEGFGYGAELATQAEILEAAGDVRTQSHGSHVAAIAAGANRKGGNPYYGVAPEADIVLVSYCDIMANSANISDAIAYIYNYAESVGKPCVVNMSLGWHQGPHDGTSPFDQVTNELQGPGKLLVGSMGNYGNDAIHVSKTFAGAEDTSLKSMVSYKVNPSKSIASGIDIWGDKGMEFDLKVMVTRDTEGREILASEVMNVAAPEGGTQEFKLSNRISGHVIITTEVNPINGKPHALLTIVVESRGNGMTVGFEVMPRSAGTVHAWADANYITFEEEVPDGWTPGDKQYTLCEIGGTGERIISVGAYVSKNVYTTQGSNQQILTNEKLHALATFSSVGPAIDGRMKPDVLAPGSYIASAVNSHDSYKSSYPTASSIEWNDELYEYSYMQGTSMAAPFVSGVLATWLQAYPELDSEMVRAVLAKTAIRDEYTDPATCGYGKLDAYLGLKELLSMTAGAGMDGVEMKQPLCLLAQQTKHTLRLLFTRPANGVEVALCNAAGHSIYRQTYPVVGEGEVVEIPLKSLSGGIYLLRVEDDVYKIVY